MAAKLKCTVVIWNLFVSSLLYSQDPVPKIVETLSQKFDKEFESGVGGVAAILHKGKVVYKKTFGHEYTGGPAITEDTYFSIGSVSKPVTALVVADLIAEKKLQLNSPLTKAFANAPVGVQLQDLLSHNSGFSYKGNWQIENGRTRKVLISELMRQGLAKQKFIYNNLAFSLIENIIEQETQDSWPNVFRQTLAKRGMDHFAIGTLASGIAVAHPHFKDEKSNKPVSMSRLPRFYPERVSSAAGVFASLNDLIKLAQVQFSPEYDFLHLPRVEANDVFNFRAPFPLPRSKIRASYGLGWRVMELREDKTQSSRLVYHGGYLRGVSAFVGLMKTHDLAVVTVRNDEFEGPMKVALGVWSAYLTASSH